MSPGNTGFTNLVRCHPTIAGKVMVCPDMWSAYQSDNYGDKWYALTDYDGELRFSSYARIVEIDRERDNKEITKRAIVIPNI